MFGLAQDVARQAGVEAAVLGSNTLYPVTVGVAGVRPSPQQCHTLCNYQASVGTQFTTLISGPIFAFI